MSATDSYLSNNSTYVAGFSKGALPMPPAREITIGPITPIDHGSRSRLPTRSVSET